MTTRRLAIVALLVALVRPTAAWAQALTTEADFTVGHSTDGTDAGAAQVRLFGPVGDAWRIYMEAAWGSVSTQGSDAFGAAYPYDGRVRPMEMFTERLFRPGESIVGIRAGRYRTPFGISGRSDYAYAGFTRAPLIRYDPIYGLSNWYFDGGVDVMAGRPALFVDGSLGTPADAGPTHRKMGTDVVVRSQAYYHSLIVGVSYMNSPSTMPETIVPGRTVFGGVDARWMLGGVELSGEWVDGRPFENAITRGGYIDMVVRRPRMGPFAVVAREEYLDYFAGPYSEFPHRVTLGTEWRIANPFSLEVNALHQDVPLINGRRTGVDVGFTYSLRR